MGCDCKLSLILAPYKRTELRQLAPTLDLLISLSRALALAVRNLVDDPAITNSNLEVPVSKGTPPDKSLSQKYRSKPTGRWAVPNIALWPWLVSSGSLLLLCAIVNICVRRARRRATAQQRALLTLELESFVACTPLPRR